MSPQDKATTERHTKTLRDLVKRPENKTCADCKHNDPRWASWNLGVFLCIRCSGIHRGMGTHISKVKSIDLDAWTPDQMKSIQSWGNKRANLYWEAHLRPGHIPPDHKMESFIRSKYESHRWAMEGPPPPDPSILDDSSTAAPSGRLSPNPIPSQTSYSGLNHSSEPPFTFPTVTPRRLQPHQLLSPSAAARDSHGLSPTPQVAAVTQPHEQKTQQTSADNLFSLDFHPPTSTVRTDHPSQQPKDIKQDILSLFSAPSVGSGYGQFSTPSIQPSPWDQPGNPSQGLPLGAGGTGSGWSITAAGPGTPWAAPPLQPHVSGASIWESTRIGEITSSKNSSASPQRKDDVFGDLWGSGL